MKNKIIGVIMGLVVFLLISKTILLGTSFIQKALKPFCKDCNVILISLDTLSANHLPCYGYKRNTSPNLCRFADKNIIFNNAFSNSNFTLPSHVSIFTGLYASQHKVNVPNADKLSSSIPFLPEMLQNTGYKTYVYIPLEDSSHLPVDKVFYRGINKITSSFHPKDWNTGLDILQKNNSLRQKTFLFLHTYWVHSPYILENEKRPLFTNPNSEIDGLPKSYKELRSCTPEFLDFLRKALKGDVENNYWDGQKKEVYTYIYKKLNYSYINGLEGDTFPCGDPYYERFIPYYFRAFYINILDKNNSAQVAYIKDAYDSKIKELDEYIQHVFDIVMNSKLKDNTIIVITADHGEEFMEHGEIGHGQNLYDTSLKVPLIMYVPGQKKLKIDQLAQSIDIMPTILNLIGYKNKTTLSGIDLFDGVRMQRNINYAEFLPLNEESLSMKSLRSADWKLIMKGSNAGNIPYELFDISHDPNEKNNLIFKREDKANELFKLVPTNE